MTFATNKIKINLKDTGVIPQMAAQIDDRCERLKIALYRKVHPDGHWSTLSVDEFKPVVDRIKTLKHLVKVVLNFKNRVSFLEDFDGSAMDKRILSEHPFASRKETYIADKNISQFLDRLYQASFNVRALSLKNYPLSSATVEPLVRFIENAPSLGVLKIAHMGLESGYRFSMYEVGSSSIWVRPSTHIEKYKEVGIDLNLEQAKERIEEAADDGLNALGLLVDTLAKSKTVHTLGFFKRRGNWEWGRWEIKTADSEKMTEKLLGNRHLHKMYLPSPYFRHPSKYFSKNIKLSNHLLSYTNQEEGKYGDYSDGFLGSKLGIPQKYVSRKEPDNLPFGINEFFDLVSYTEEKGAALNKFEEMVRKGMSVNLWDENYDTPLHKACENGNLFMVKILLKRKAFVMHNKELKTPIDIAKEQTNSEELLEAFGINQIHRQAISDRAAETPMYDNSLVADLKYQIHQLEIEKVHLQVELDEKNRLLDQSVATVNQQHEQLKFLEKQVGQLTRQNESMIKEVKNLRSELDNLRGF